VVIVVVNGVAQLRTIEIGPNNGIEAQVTSGLSKDERVVLYPTSGLSEGMSVVERVIN
jgi:HlyD family secretion protein